jgi:hypothetical protein
LYGVLLNITNWGYFYELEGVGRKKNRTLRYVIYDVLLYGNVWETRKK